MVEANGKRLFDGSIDDLLSVWQQIDICEFVIWNEMPKVNFNAGDICFYRNEKVNNIFRPFSLKTPSFSVNDSSILWKFLRGKWADK